MDFYVQVLDLITKRQISSALNCNNSMFCIREYKIRRWVMVRVRFR